MSTQPAPKRTSMHGQWSSRFTFILAATGAAVGLGNIWKFPYMAGDNGGSAFVLVYLACVMLIGIPIMMAEMLLGRLGRRNPVDSLRALATDLKHTAAWRYAGWLGAFTLLLVLSFYSVVAGWSLAYLVKAWQGAFTGLNPAQINGLWQQFLADPLQVLIWHAVFMALTLWVVAQGVRNGLERASKFMMPLLFAILIVLDGYGTGTGAFNKALHFLFSFNLHKLTPTVVIAALGHAFFTLAIGAGAMLVYGAYLPDNAKIGEAVLIIAALDVLVAVLAGLAIFPLVFAHHLAPQAGPGLMFQVLPIAFAHMEGGRFFGGLFFMLLFFAAWSSSISMAEPLVMLLIERWKLSRHVASVIIGVFTWTLGVASALSFNVWKNVTLFGHWRFFTATTDLATNITLPIGGLLFALFVGWRLPKALAQTGLHLDNKILFTVWRGLIRYAAPIGILIILFSAL